VKALFDKDPQKDIVVVVVNNMEEMLVEVLEDKHAGKDVEYIEYQYRNVFDVLLVQMMMVY
jgi:hypothetical protein